MTRCALLVLCIVAAGLSAAEHTIIFKASSSVTVMVDAAKSFEYHIWSNGSISYDIASRPSGIGGNTITYDVARRVSKVADCYISYDVAGRVTKVGSVYVSYDISGRISKIGSVGVGYDISGRLSRVGACDLTYNVGGDISRLSTIPGNGVILRYKQVDNTYVVAPEFYIENPNTLAKSPPRTDHAYFSYFPRQVGDSYSFDFLPSTGAIYIYDTSGSLVSQLPVGTRIWDGCNDAGARAATGFYVSNVILRDETTLSSHFFKK